jgi:phage replication-related protein YjqB (UPF0714/DUF867 family)
MLEGGEVHEYIRLEGSLGLMAVHGGGIEPGTEEIARFVAYHSGASLYVYAGRRSGGNLSLHRPSHDGKIEKRALAVQFLEHVNTAISIHGHGRRRNSAYVGGLHETMVQRFVVNLPPAKGMQLELPVKLRETRRSPGGRGYEPAGDALLLSRLLIRFVGTVINESS